MGFRVRNDRTLLERVVRTGFSQEGTSEQRHNERDGASRVVSWGEWVLGTGSSKCKGPKAGTCWVYFWNTEKMSMAGVERAGGEGVGEFGDGGVGEITRGLVGHTENFGVYSKR